MDGLTTVAAPPARAIRLGHILGSLITFIETLRLALYSLRAHKLRSFLTLLGVILAVTTLVVVMSVVAGMNFYVADRIANLGANVFIVDRFGIITSNDQWVKAQKRPLLTMDEFEYLRDNMKTANAVAALDDRNMDLKAGNERLERTDVMGVTANYTDVRNIGVAQGRMITESDDEHRSQVVFIGADVVAKLFANVDPIGKTLRAETHEYQVIGVATPIGSAFGQSPDNFAILGSDSIMALWHQLTGTLATVAVGLVSVFLVVGGIVIMNIMLASVTERTREIGVRRSLGARKIHIMLQFMTESGVLAAVGGVMGLIAAYALVTLGRTLTSIPMQMPLGAVVLSLVVSTAVGLFFGIYPAMRAAKLDPIEALRADG